MKRNLIKYFIVIIPLILVITMIIVKFNNKYGLDKDNPITIKVWHYYNGEPKVTFDNMINEFNYTVGKENGIIVKANNKNSINGVIDAVKKTINKEVGSAESLPNIFSAYTDTAYKIDKLGLLVDFNKYISKNKLNKYVEGYIEEGKLDNDGSIKILPIAKSTEIMMINKVVWDKFSKETGAQLMDLKTYEGIAKVAKEYYRWTDSMTEAKYDGRAFFGRDSMSNYMIIGSKQLGKEIISIHNGQANLNLNRDIMKKLWDNFYIPYINGYYAAYGKFRSDDIKTEDIIALVGSTSGSLYFPKTITIDDNETYETEAIVMEAPNFENGQNYYMNQGAGMVVTKSDEAHEYASILFLEWFTENTRSIEFSKNTGYLPVKRDLNIDKAFNNIIESNESTFENVNKATLVAINQIKNNILYTTKGYEYGNEVRNLLEKSLIDKANLDLDNIRKKVYDEGKDREKIIQEYESEESFGQWMNELKNELSKYIVQL